MRRAPYPEFAWSVSRANLFEFCRRKYYHRYYGMWGGWEEQADDKTKLTYLLSRRTSLSGWVGQEVHRAIAIYLAGQQPMEQIIVQTRDRMRSLFRQSRSRRFMKPGRAKDFGLCEHFYQHETPLRDQDVRDRWLQVENSLVSFAQSSYRQDAQRATKAGRLVYIEDPDSTDFELMSLRQHGLGAFKIYAHPDFVITYDDGLTCIMDWKTGLAPETARDCLTEQLSFYGLWVTEKLSNRQKLNKIEAYEFYLPSQTLCGDRLEPGDIQASLAYAKSSIEKMRSLLVDQELNRAREEDFVMSESQAKCASCEYRVVCY